MDLGQSPAPTALSDVSGYSSVLLGSPAAISNPPASRWSSYGFMDSSNPDKQQAFISSALPLPRPPRMGYSKLPPDSPPRPRRVRQRNGRKYQGSFLSFSQEGMQLSDLLIFDRYLLPQQGDYVILHVNITDVPPAIGLEPVDCSPGYPLAKRVGRQSQLLRRLLAV